jgi:hypothetical protein
MIPSRLLVGAEFFMPPMAAMNARHAFGLIARSAQSEPNGSLDINCYSTAQSAASI